MFTTLRTIALALLVYCTTGAAKATTEEFPTEVPYMELKSGLKAADFPLISTQVDAKITDGIVRATIIQEYRNQQPVPIEAIYTFPLSTRAAVHAMEMQLGQRVIKAQIKEKVEARKIYLNAKAANKAASLLEQKRPNVFQSKVANIQPGETVTVTLTFTELIVPEDNTYEWVFPTVVGPRYHGTGDEAADQADLEWVQSPYLETAKAKTQGVPVIEPEFQLQATVKTSLKLQAFQCPSHKAKLDFISPQETTITLDSAQDGYQANRDFIVRFKLADSEIATGLLTHHSDEENFFLLNVQPPERVTPEHIPAREYHFVIDVSGSMHGFPLKTAKTLFQELSNTLRPIDHFNIQCFAGGSEMLSEKALPATKANIVRAQNMLSQLNGRGGTNLNTALKKALAMHSQQDRSRNIIIITDGFISADQKSFQIIREHRAQANIFSFGIGSSVNRHLIEGMAKVGGGEPFVVTHPKQASNTAKRFAQYIASPVLTNIQIEATNLELSEVQPAQINDLFAQRALTLTGKWKAKNHQAGQITISGQTGNGKRFQQSFRIDPKKPSTTPVLRELWARETVRELIDFNQVAADKDLKKRITNLGLEYELITPFTSFVAVDDSPRKLTQKATPVTQPLPLPSGVASTALSPAQNVSNGSIPEPSTSILTLITLVITLCIRRR